MRAVAISPAGLVTAAGADDVHAVSLRVVTLRWVAGFCHICRFIAGAAISGMVRASTVVRADHRCGRTSRARKSADAGAISITSLLRVSSMWAAVVRPRVPEVAGDRRPGQRLERGRADEFARRPSSLPLLDGQT